MIQNEARLFRIGQQLFLVDGGVVLLVLAAQPRGHGYQAEEGRAQALRRLAPAVHFLGFETVAPRGQDLVESESVGPVGQQGQQEGTDELGVGQPGGVARLAAFEAEHVDEDRRGAAEQDVVRRAVLEAEAVGEQRLRQIQGEQSGGMQHLGIPLVGKAGEIDALMLQDHLPAARVVEFANGGVGQQLAALGGVQRAGGDNRAGGHQLPAGWRGQEGLQVGGSDVVDHAQNAAPVAEEAAGGIAEGCGDGLCPRRRLAQSFGPFRFLNQDVIRRK